MRTAAPGPGEKAKRTIQSVVRAASILKCFEHDNELQIGEISARVGLTKSTTHHLLATLKEMHFVKQNPRTKGYSLGIEVFKLGYAYFNQLNLVSIARPFLTALSDSTKETVHLAELNGTEVVYLDKIDGPLSISMRSRIGISKPAYCTGLGKILLAHQSQENLAGILERLVLVPHTENTITDKSVLLQRLGEYRSRGYSIDNEEIEIGLFCIAAPIIDITGQAMAAISLAAPKYRVEKRLDELIPQVMNTAAGISFELGSRADDE